MRDRPLPEHGPAGLRLPLLGTASAHAMVQLAGELGLPRERCLAGTGITPSLLDDAFATIRLSQELALAGNLVDGLGQVPALGFRLGRRYRLTMYGAWGWALLCSATPRRALGFAAEFLDLSYSLCELSLREDGGLVRIGVSEQWLPQRLRAFLLQRCMGGIVRLLCDLLPPGGWLKEVSFTAPEGPDALYYRTAIEAPVWFGRPENELVIHAGALDQPMPMADGQALQLAESLCRDLLARRRAMLSVGEGVRQYLRQRLPWSPTPTEAAQALGMGARTLRRRLAEEDTCFRELHDEVRRACAVELLQEGVPPVQVARRLGYAGPAAFTHAFRRWYGLAPREFLS